MREIWRVLKTVTEREKKAHGKEPRERERKRERELDR